jgi:hypothetical protein
MLYICYNALVVYLSLFTATLAYPQHNQPHVARADKFVIGAMGDSWAVSVY